MNNLPEFKGFPKIARLNRTVVVTEKIDGTNGIVHVGEDGVVTAGSRNQWVTPEKDNAGFAKWVATNAEELKRLGPGYHYGEWWGQGIQRKYGMTEKKFSLFNTHKFATIRPACCDVVPVLAYHTDIRWAVDSALNILRTTGSKAAPGFMRPEGIVAFHSASGTLYKVTLEDDDVPKGKISAEAI